MAWRQVRIPAGRMANVAVGVRGAAAPGAARSRQAGLADCLRHGAVALVNFKRRPRNLEPAIHDDRRLAAGVADRRALQARQRGPELLRPQSRSNSDCPTKPITADSGLSKHDQQNGCCMRRWNAPSGRPEAPSRGRELLQRKTCGSRILAGRSRPARGLREEAMQCAASRRTRTSAAVMRHRAHRRRAGALLRAEDICHAQASAPGCRSLSRSLYRSSRSGARTTAARGGSHTRQRPGLPDDGSGARHGMTRSLGKACTKMLRAISIPNHTPLVVISARPH